MVWNETLLASKQRCRVSHRSRRYSHFLQLLDACVHGVDELVSLEVIFIDVRDEADMNTGNSVDYYVGRSVCAKVGRGNNYGVDSDIGNGFGNGDNVEVELEAVNEVCCGFSRIVDKVFKHVIGGASVGVGDSIS